MRVNTTFQFIDALGRINDGEIWIDHEGAFIPDSLHGMGKRYKSIDYAVRDYVRRLGGSFVQYLSGGEEL